jgi:putative ABC transport system permease protein
VFYLRYIAAELRRRKGRTIFTTLGLAVGVGMVAIVAALSNGLDDAQSKVLAPLVGLGTDMSVDRPLALGGPGSSDSSAAGAQRTPLSASEQRELRKENAAARLDMQSLLRGKPGTRFARDWFTTSDRLSFPEREADLVSRVDGVAQTSTGLTLSVLRVSGVIPTPTGPLGISPTAGLPRGITLEQETISGVGTRSPDLALVTPAQIVAGRYLAAGAAGARQSVISQAYASRKQLRVGQLLRLAGRKFTIVGIAKPPLGGETSDIYVRLAVLQGLSDRRGRVNVLRVRATSAAAIDNVAAGVRHVFPGSQVTTARDLADRVSGSFTDAKNLSSKLGTALAAVALAAAVLIASLLTLASISKRTRELGTLKAIGWRQRLVIRQITGEALAQGALGGVIGAAIGVGASLVVSAVGPTLTASVTGATPQRTGPVATAIGAFGQGQVLNGSSTVKLDAPLDAGLLLLAVALALFGGLVAGAVGATRAARLRPAVALRSVE